jgi:hypothetical protein
VTGAPSRSSEDLVKTRISRAAGHAFARYVTTYCAALLLAAAAVCAFPARLAAAAVSRTTITVRVCQNASLPSMVEQRALAEAGAVLRAASVDVRWRKCAGPDVDASSAAFELVLRIVDARQDTPAVLGTAGVIRSAGGVLATVYANRVAVLANQALIEVAVLLGGMAAHELGHLMMQTSVHTRHGLMRSHWTTDELRRNLAPDWTFTARDVAAMRQPGPDY